MLDLVEKFEEKLKAIDEQMSDPAIASDQKQMIELGRERRHVEDVLEVGRRYRGIRQAIDDAREMIKADEDDDITEMAREELEEKEAQLEKVEYDLKMKLLPKDPNDDKAAVVEIRAGTGGDEAALFAGDIYRMYERYADKQGWKQDVLTIHPAEGGGFKEVIFALEGGAAYGIMKFESGVHRVQRVPETESQGRIHTSAVSVAVLPEAEEVDIDIAENELKIDVYRSSGPGGQSVNTTDSAVRITHLPTGLVVTCQDEKSQHKNRAKALKVLRSRLLDREMAEHNAKIAAQRRSMISTGDRSAKIRTYNFPQGRVTDHRINLTLYKLDQILAGELDEVIEQLRQHEQEEQLKLQEKAEV